MRVLGLMVLTMILGAVRGALGSPLEPLIGKIHSETLKHYYGTAVLVEQDGDRLYYVTNAHLIPASPRHRQHLYLFTPQWGQRKHQVELIGLSPGYDIAVLSLPRPPIMPPEVGHLLDKRLLREAVPNGSFHWGLLGYPGPQASRRPVLAAQTWREIALRDLHRMLELEPIPEKAAGSLSEPLALQIEPNCPPVFVPLCYRVPIRSWGYSGGALVAARAEVPEEHYMVGLVSHFEPLSHLTYAIPLPVVWQVYRQIRREARRGTLPVVSLKHLNGNFAFVSHKEVEILTGPHQGKQVRARQGSGNLSSWPAGSGEGVGGGGPPAAWHAPDWGTVFRGDFDALAKELTTGDWWEAKAGSGGALDLLRSLPAFRGVDAVWTYLPGVTLGETEQPVYRYGSAVVDSLQDFVNFYTAFPQGRLADHFPKAPPLPVRFELTGDVRLRAGLHSFAGVRKIRGGASPGTLNPLEKRALATGSGASLLTSRPSMNEISTIAVGKVARDGKHIHVELGDAAFGFFRLRFSDALEQVGAYSFRYAGTIEMRTPLGGGTEHTVVGQGFVTLHYFPDLKSFEMKVVLGFVAPPESTDVNPSLTEEQIIFDGFYVNLVPATDKAE